MEVYSGQKKAKSIVTLASTTTLMVIALLQAFSMVYQKERYWQHQLGEPVDIDATLRLRIPKHWMALGDASGNSWWFVSAGQSDGDLKLLVLRPPAGRLHNLREACEFVFDRGELPPGRGHIEGHPPLPCRLGELPAELTIAQLPITEVRAQVRVILASFDRTYGTTILVMFPSRPEEVAPAKYLLLEMARTARLRG